MTLGVMLLIKEKYLASSLSIHNTIQETLSAKSTKNIPHYGKVWTT